MTSLIMESKEQNKLTKYLKQRHGHREQTESCQRGEAWGNQMKESEGIKQKTIFGVKQK